MQIPVKNLGLALLVGALLSSCKQPKKDHLIFGQLRYKDSGEIVVPDKRFEIHVTQKYSYPSNIEDNVFAFTTDSQGYFNLHIDVPKNGEIDICYPDKKWSDRFWHKPTADIIHDANAGIIYVP